LKDMFLGHEEDSAPLYYLLSDMLKTLEFKLNTLCKMLEEEFGAGIKVYMCDDVVPGVPKGTFLCIAMGPSQSGKV
jgi:hypothetical protein